MRVERERGDGSVLEAEDEGLEVLGGIGVDDGDPDGGDGPESLVADAEGAGRYEGPGVTDREAAALHAEVLGVSLTSSS